MTNWYQKVIKISQTDPAAGQSTEQTRIAIWNEKKAMMDATINNFIAQVGTELINRNLQDLMNVNNPTVSMGQAIEAITSQIDMQNALATQTTELLQKVSGEVAKTILQESAHGNRTGNVYTIINSTKSPIREMIDLWFRYYRVPDEEVNEAMKK